MSENGNEKHGPHGPGCTCDDDEILTVGMAMATALAEILKPLLDRWEAGDDGVTVDFRFDRGKEVAGIAVRARPLEDGEDWPIPDDPDALLASIESGNEKERVH